VFKLSIPKLDARLIFPPVEEAENGIVAIGGDLSTERLLLAYSKGIFPWYNEDEPIMWWCPDQRFIMLPHEVHVSKSMRRVINSQRFTVTFDTDFYNVIEHCAFVKRKDGRGTWITEEMMDAYCALHESGYAHSVEVWEGPKLAGGLYGVSLGKCFFAESMFHTAGNASKLAYIVLAQYLEQHHFVFLDAQIYTEHVETLGAKNVSRNKFLKLLQEGLSCHVPPGKWKR
jgi:leucyl/phenylalanyl-tRNA--protein transferase